MRRPIAAVLAAALTGALLTLAPSAQAAPPTATWSGAAGGDTTKVDLDVLNGLQLAGARLAVSQADAGSTRTPRATARSANLGATVAGLPLTVLANSESAGPAAGSSSSSPGLGASAAGVVTLGALDAADSARWDGDNRCVTAGDLASASTTVASVKVAPPVFPKTLLTTASPVTTTGSTRLAATSSGSLNQGVRSTATASLLNADVLGLKIGVAGGSTLSASADGRAGGGSTAYDAGTVTVNDGQDVVRVLPGSPRTTTLSLATLTEAVVTVTANTPTTTVESDGTSTDAKVAVVTVSVTLKAIAPVTGIRSTLATAGIDLLPLRASAAAPTGGIDCPPAAPTVTRPADGSSTNDTTPTFEGTGVPGARVALTVDGTVVAGSIAVGGDGRWSYDATAALSPGSHRVSAVQSVGGTPSEASATTAFTVDTSPPAAPTLTRPVSGSTTADTTPDYVGTAEAGSTVDVYEGSTRVATGSADASGGYTLTSDRLDDGSHTVRAVATDAAGNSSTASETTTFTVDSTAPDPPRILGPADQSSTPQARPAISGTAEVGSSVTVRVDGTAVGTVTATDGTFSVTPTDALPQGAHVATATAADANGNVSDPSASVRFTVDGIAPAAPVITTPTAGGSVGQVRPPVRGTAEAGASVEVLVDGVAVGRATADTGGRFAVTPDRDLAAGTRVATAVATDAAGNVSPTSDSVSFTIDLTAPAAPTITTPANGVGTRDTTPTIGGSAEAGASVEVFVDGASVGITTATGTGAWSLESTVLDDGSHVARAVATDAAGNGSLPSAPVTFTVDRSTPDAPVVTAPAAGSTTRDNTPTTRGTAEAGVFVEVFLGGESIGVVTADGLGVWTLDAPQLADGSYVVTAKATDQAGNASQVSAVVSFTVDTTGPAAPVVSEPGDGDVVGDLTPTISGTAEAGSRVEVFVDGSSVGTTTASSAGRWQIDAPLLTESQHDVSATATDVVGNTGPSSPTSVFFVDVTRPAPPVVLVPENASSTNDPTPTISGTAEVDASVEVFVDGKSVGTADADGDGRWSLDSTALDDGPHFARAVATDAAGNTSLSSLPVAFDVDATAPAAPVLTSPANGSTTNDTTPTVSGTAVGGARIVVTLDGTQAGTTTAGTLGAWSLDLPQLIEGSYTVYATAADTLGNVSGRSNANTFTVDVTSPITPVLATPANGSSTKDATPTFVGTAEAGTTVKVYEGTTQLGSGPATGGSFSIAATSSLGEGAHTVYVTATDAAGNVSVRSNTNTFTVDTGEPAPVVTAPKPGSTTNDTTPTIEGTANADSTITVRVDAKPVGTTTADGSGNWSLTPADALEPGDRTVTATATDALGNTSDLSAGVSFTIDTKAPTAPVLAKPANGSTSSDTTPAFVGTAEAGSTVKVYEGTTVLGSGPATVGAFSIDSIVTLPEGPHTVSVTATDGAGNVSDPSNANTFTVDVTAPAVPVVTAPQAGSTTNEKPTVEGTADAGATVEVFVDGDSAGTTNAASSGRWSLPLTDALDEGSHTVAATAADALGNTSDPSAGVTFTVDATAPTAPVLTLPADQSATKSTTPTYTGTAEAGMTVKVYEAATLLGAGTATGGSFSIVSSTLGEGAHTVFVTATDAFGHVSVQSNANTFTVDVTAPAVPVVAAPKAGSTTNDTTPTITGTAEGGAPVEVFVDGKSVGTTTANGSGNWLLTPSGALDPGVHIVTATAADALGNTSGPSAGVSFTVDTTKPAAPVITVPTNGSTSKDETPTITGTAEGGASIEVFVDGKSVGTTTATTQGAWTLDSTALVDGEHTVTAVATDAAGNGSDASPGVVLTIDTTAPAAPLITVPEDGSETTDATPTIGGTAEAGASIEVFVDGTSIGTVAATTGSWSLTSPLLDLGGHAVAAEATDEAGNVSVRSAVRRFALVSGTLTPPVVTTPTQGATVDGPEVTVCGTGAPGDTVLLSRVTDSGDEALGQVVVDDDGTWCLDVDLPEGASTLRAVQVTPDGEVSGVSLRRFVVSARQGSGNGGGSSGGGSSSGGSSDHGGLASTGGPSLALAAAAVVLLGSGAGAVIVSRRRRRRS